MERKKIKLELSNLSILDPKPNIVEHEGKANQIITDLFSSTSDVKNMTGWINLPNEDALFKKVEEFTTKIVSSEKYEHLLVLGIGGSSLGAQALIEGLKTNLWNRISKGKRKGFLTTDFIDNLDPVIIRTLLKKLKLDKTLFVVISKGGGTIETIVPMLIVKEWLEEEGKNFYEHAVFITTNGKGLLFELAKKNNVPLFDIPENVGGRYSVFSAVGLLPAAFAGVDLGEIKQGIKEAYSICSEKDLRVNIALTIALVSYSFYKAGKNMFVLMPYSSSLRRFVDWFVQLWAESLGKSGKGSTPICAIGATDQHSQLQLFNQGPNDKLICFVKINKHKKDLKIKDFSSEDQSFRKYSNLRAGEILNIELDATRRALAENKRPNFMITLPELDEYYLSQLMYIFEFATAIAGKLLDVNPFDQPGVELAKKYTNEGLVNR